MIKLYFFLLTGLVLPSLAMTPAGDQEKALFDAIKQGNLEGVKKALDANAHIEAQSPLYNMTPLIAAAEKGHLDIVEFLLSKNANPQALSKDDMSALHWAASGNVKPELIELLIKSGIPADAADDEGNTPIHGVTSIPVAQALLSHGVDINKRNIHGQTPIWQIVSGMPHSTLDHTTIINLIACLLELGADPYTKDNRGRSAEDLAADIQEPDIKSRVTKLLEKSIKDRIVLYPRL